MKMNLNINNYILGILVLFFLCPITHSLNAFAKNNDKVLISEVAVCDDENEWPPYAFYQKDAQGKKTQQIEGFSIDVLDYIMKKHAIKYKLEFLPWNRCLNLVKDYKDKMALVLQFSTSPDREVDYLLTKPYYHATPAIFYSKRKFKDGLNVSNLSDLKKYSACGFFGYSYLPIGFKDGEMDTGSRTIEHILDKIKHGRCDFFQSNIEIIAGYKYSNNIDVFNDPQVDYEILKFAPSSYFSMGVSRKHPYATHLLDLLNTEFSIM